MNGFEKVSFTGVFRNYQQRVLDNADKHLKDGKINIVAAPGSGKTVLGLELICRIGQPCIILSPTTAIRQQWGERLKELFIKNQEDFEDIFSSDLHKVKLFNSVTYQALYTAIEKVSCDEEDDFDCSDIELFELMKANEIKTICLDEAHHLKNEWQKALEKFISGLDKDVKIISLTATPPYDSDGNEWNRYLNICGEIDEEIFVPELVGKNTLCPHQDYVYFNYPTVEEESTFEEYKVKALNAVEEIGKLPTIKALCDLLNSQRDYEKLFSAVEEYVSLLILMQHYGLEVDKKLIKELTSKKTLPEFKMEYAEKAIQFLIDDSIITEEQKEEILDILKKHSVYEKRKVTLHLNERLKRALISSVGKLESIKKIVKSEIDAMGEKLRMLVLTDYIKKENVSKIATDEKFDSINIISIFETIRRESFNVNIGVLSGTLVILPKCIDISDVKHKKEDIPNTDYCIVDISGATHRAVDYVGNLFKAGKLQILVGTKSLLGEGWDSPCINSLILASFVGSFVLSNQMRGRAIRIDKNDPEKTSNIWHLVTVEPDNMFDNNQSDMKPSYSNQSDNELVSYDFEVLKRRFNSFMGPNYETGVIESGIERITAIKPPYNKDGIEKINKEMLSLSSQRKDVKKKWLGEVANGHFTVGVETEVPKESKAPTITFLNFTFVALIAALMVFLLIPLFGFIRSDNVPMIVLTISLEIALFVVLCVFGRKILHHSTPSKSVKTIGKAVYKTLCLCDLISSSATVSVMSDERTGRVSVQLQDATVRDQNIFNTAISEMLSPIENPRYILIAKTRFNRYNYKLSFACPSVIGKKKEYVEVLSKKLKGTTGNFEAVYTHREDGRQLILKCRKRSYITFSQKISGKKYKVSHWK